MRELGVDAVQRYNHELAWNAGQEMGARWNSRVPAPEEMVGTMVSLPLPERLGSTREDAAALRHALLFENDIEVHLYSWNQRLHLRVSAQIYNDMGDFEKLIRAMDSRL